MDELGLTEHVLPELHALHGVEQNRYHHLDVHGHTLEVLDEAIELERDPAPHVGDELAAARAGLPRRAAGRRADPRDALRFGALLHDAAKPQTRDGHREASSRSSATTDRARTIARDVLTRLRTSERLRAHVAALARHHLRLGFLVHEQPLDRRAVYSYLRRRAPVAVDVTLLSIADRLATRGRKADEAIAKHLDLARVLLGEALDVARRAAHEPLVRGDELAAALGIAPGPRLGELLAAIEEARFAGEVSTRAPRRSISRGPCSGPVDHGPLDCVPADRRQRDA